jgi:hypothetical protein
MPRATPSLLAPAGISGLVFGFLGGAPLVGLLNCACCSLILSCGFVAALLDSRNRRSAGVAFDSIGGLKVGLLSGVVYALVATLTGAAGDLLFHQATTKWALELLEQSSRIDPEVGQWLTQGIEHGLVPSILLGLLLNLALGILFATLGGLIGGAVFRHAPASAAPGGAP